MTIKFREEDGGDVVLEKGDVLVIPKGMEHCPDCEDETEVMLIEKVGTVNTGDAPSSEKTSMVEDFRS